MSSCACEFKCLGLSLSLFKISLKKSLKITGGPVSILYIFIMLTFSYYNFGDNILSLCFIKTQISFVIKTINSNSRPYELPIFVPNETKENCYALHETDLETDLAYLIFKEHTWFDI